jgi:diguanylate cyclase
VEAVDWKKKHLDALREMEVEERRWKALEAVLRRLVARLCAAATGIDDRLDAQLSKVSKAARGSSDEIELHALSESLADAVRALERDLGAPEGTATGVRTNVPGFTAPAGARTHVPGFTPSATQPVSLAPPARWERTCAATDALLQRLAATEPDAAGVADLRASLVAVRGDAELAGVLGRVADLVGSRGEALARERAAAAAMLAQVTERLEEMVAYLAVATADRAASRDAADTLNTQVLARVSSLTRAVGDANDLPTLRRLVADRLEDVAVQVREFHARETARFEQEAARSDRLKARIVELETQARGLHRELDQERKKARLDPLTRVANRAAFDEKFADEFTRWQRFRAPVSLVLVDVDRFKAINDAFGHRAGDAALREIAARLESRRRATDALARWGGEEFALLLVGTALADAQRVAEELRERVETLGLHFRGTPVTLTVSCGLTEFREGDTPEAVFERADRALYRAKREGRNRCVAD